LYFHISYMHLSANYIFRDKNDYYPYYYYVVGEESQVQHMERSTTTDGNHMSSSNPTNQIAPHQLKFKLSLSLLSTHVVTQIRNSRPEKLHLHQWYALLQLKNSPTMPSMSTPSISLSPTTVTTPPFERVNWNFNWRGVILLEGQDL